MDKVVILIIIAVVLVGAGFFLIVSHKTNAPVIPTPLPAGIVFFYGDTCSHCKNVEDFNNANGVSQKVQFTSLEIFENQNNAALAYQVETGCKIDVSKGIEVPLVYDGTKCYLGEPDVINFFKTQAGIK